MSEASDTDAAKRSLERAHFVRNQFPPGGLFAGLNWRIATEPFKLGDELSAEIESLGRVLLQFNRAANLLYRQSVAGKQPEWIAQWLDIGKPPELVGIQRHAVFKNEIPRVIRPDFLLTDGGLALTELDAVPGGIGLTAWLNRTYAETGAAVIGGAEGMLRGFAGMFTDAPDVQIVISEEAATYRPEMEWMAAELNSLGFSFVVRDTSPFPLTAGGGVYRFFELFDLPNVTCAPALIEAALKKQIQLTAPIKPIFEEKMLFALLWNRNLRAFWRQELGEGFFERMLRLTPYTWAVIPEPIPPHAAIPELGLTDWQQLKGLSQKERDLILKLSGFSPDAWGARSVSLGSDLSLGDWSAAVDRALDAWKATPYVLQRFARPRSLEFQYFDFDRQESVRFASRVRLSPYYFVVGQGDTARATLGGILATACPAEKKIIHGMRDATLAPCVT